MFCNTMDGQIRVPAVEPRLQRRYRDMVKGHVHCTSRASPGPTAVMKESSSFAATQACWRFLNNDRVTLAGLIEPLQAAGRDAVEDSESAYALLVHDWSKLKYDHHTSKPDTVQLTHEHDVGYELGVSLLVDAENGAPLAPMQMTLKTAHGILNTNTDMDLDEQAHVDQILPTMEASRDWAINRTLVHVVDREADSVGHYRQWDAAGHRFLVRGDDRKVLYNETSMRMSAVADALFAEGKDVTDGGSVTYRGAKAQSMISEANVVLHRPARRRTGGRQIEIPGDPLPVRLVVVRVVDSDDQVHATWYLLSNVPSEDVPAKTLGQWYYWRWRIESYFKLLKSHGQHIEQWQQACGEAIARRLLVAAMACVVVWELSRAEDEASEELRDFLVRLSGRQMKHGTRFTASALLAGLFMLLPMLELIEQYDGDLSSIQNLAQQTLPWLKPG